MPQLQRHDRSYLARIPGIRASRVVVLLSEGDAGPQLGQERTVQFRVTRPAFRPTPWWRRRTLATALLLWTVSATGLLFVLQMAFG